MPGVLKGVEYSDPFTRYKGQRILDNLSKIKPSAAKGVSIDLAIDVYYSLYLPFPRLVEPSAVPLGGQRHFKVIKSLLTIDEMKRLRLYSVADSFVSTALGTLFLINLLDELMNRGEGSERAHGGSASNASKTKERGRGEEEGDRGLEEAIKSAVKKSLEAAETIKEIKSFAYGYKAGVGHVLNLEDDVIAVIKLAKSADIKNLLALLTRIPDVSSIVRKKYVEYQRGEVRGYTRGSDVERIVHSELAYPPIYFYTKLAEGDLLLVEKAVTMSMGPIYVLLDKSGSMDGNKILWAKATALALFLKSRAERRAFYMRFFDSEPYDLMVVRPYAKPSEAIKFLEYVAAVKNGGGTDISKALLTACNDIAKHGIRGVGDIILVTDGEDRIAKGLIRKALNHSRLRLISVMVMGDNEDLKNVSDVYMRVAKLSDKEILKVVKV